MARFILLMSNAQRAESTEEERSGDSDHHGHGTRSPERSETRLNISVKFAESKGDIFMMDWKCIT